MHLHEKHPALDWTACMIKPVNYDQKKPKYRKQIGRVEKTAYARAGSCLCGGNVPSIGTASS